VNTAHLVSEHMRKASGLSSKVSARLAKSGSQKQRDGSPPPQQHRQQQQQQPEAASAQAAQSAMPPPQAQPAKQAQPPPGRVERQYSTASWNTVTTLQQYEAQALEMQQRSLAAEEILKQPPADGLPAELRNELAQLHGDANRLLANQLDAILTSARACSPRLCPPRARRAAPGLRRSCRLACCPAAVPGDLNSGKEDARAKRKQLIKMVEALIEAVEKQVKRFDAIRGSTP
jgi:hypothetical protein